MAKALLKGVIVAGYNITRIGKLNFDNAQDRTTRSPEIFSKWTSVGGGWCGAGYAKLFYTSCAAWLAAVALFAAVVLYSRIFVSGPACSLTSLARLRARPYGAPQRNPVL